MFLPHPPFLLKEYVYVLSYVKFMIEIPEWST